MTTANNSRLVSVEEIKLEAMYYGIYHEFDVLFPTPRKVKSIANNSEYKAKWKMRLLSAKELEVCHLRATAEANKQFNAFLAGEKLPHSSDNLLIQMEFHNLNIIVLHRALQSSDVAYSDNFYNPNEIYDCAKPIMVDGEPVNLSHLPSEFLVGLYNAWNDYSIKFNPTFEMQEKEWKELLEVMLKKPGESMELIGRVSYLDLKKICAFFVHRNEELEQQVKILSLNLQEQLNNS